MGFSGDIADPNTCEEIVSKTVDKFGRIDTLVNNAGIFLYGSVRDAPMDQFDSIFSVNLRPVVLLTKLCLPYLEKTKGSIVNNSSTAGLKSFTNVSYYCMSKVRKPLFWCFWGHQFARI